MFIGSFSLQIGFYLNNSVGCFGSSFLVFKGCVTIEDPQTVILHAPKESPAMKNCERGIGHSVHKFTFSQVSRLFLIFNYIVGCVSQLKTFYDIV